MKYQILDGGVWREWETVMAAEQASIKAVGHQIVRIQEKRERDLRSVYRDGIAVSTLNTGVVNAKSECD